MSTMMKLASVLSLLVAWSVGTASPAAAQAACPRCQGCNINRIVKVGTVGPLRPGVLFPRVPVETFDSSLGLLTGIQITGKIDVLNRRFDFENKDFLSPCGGSVNNPDYFQNVNVS